MKTNPITFPAHRYATRVTDKISVVPSITPPHPPTPVQVASAALSVRNSDDEEDEEDVPSLEDVDANFDDAFDAPDEANFDADASDEAIHTPEPTTPEPTQRRGQEFAGSSSYKPLYPSNFVNWLRTNSPLPGSRLQIRRQPSPQRLPSPLGIPNLVRAARNLQSQLGEFWNQPSSRRPPRNREPDDKS